MNEVCLDESQLRDIGYIEGQKVNRGRYNRWWKYFTLLTRRNIFVDDIINIDIVLFSSHSKFLNFQKMLSFLLCIRKNLARGF